MKILKVGMDIDGVVANFLSSMTKLSAEMLSRPSMLHDKYTVKENYTSWKLEKLFPASKEEFEMILSYIKHHPNFILNYLYWNQLSGFTF